MTLLLDSPGIDTDAQFRRIVDELTRRGFLAGGIGAAAALGLAACTTGTSSEAPSATRKVQTSKGTIAVPANPRRVITTDGYSTTTMFDLGLTPIGVFAQPDIWIEPQYRAAWATATKISNDDGELDLEKIARLRPDLIFGIDNQSNLPYEELSALAPTVLLANSTATVPWRQLADDVAADLGQTAGLTKLRTQYEDKVRELRDRYADVLASTRWNLVHPGFAQGAFRVYGSRSLIGGIFSDMGMRFASASAATSGSGVSAQRDISYEQLTELDDADAIFYYTTSDGKPAGLGEQLFTQALWQRLPAVTSKHLVGSIYFLPTSYTDATGALVSLEPMLAALKKEQR